MILLLWLIIISVFNLRILSLEEIIKIISREPFIQLSKIRDFILLIREFLRIRFLDLEIIIHMNNIDMNNVHRQIHLQAKAYTAIHPLPKGSGLLAQLG
jgi:hypothetical protein